MADAHYDVIVIGSGPGGASFAHRLAATGKRILILERGDYLPRSRANWDSQAVFVDGVYQAKETWYGGDGREFHPGASLLRRRELQGLWRGAAAPARARLRRASPRGRHLARLAAALRGLRALLCRGRAAVPRARAARRGPERAAFRRAVPVSTGLARAGHPGAERSASRRGPAPLPSAPRHTARGEGRQGDTHESPASAATPSTASLAP